MRVALAALVLALASAPLYAQRTDEKKEPPKKVMRSAPPDLPQDRQPKHHKPQSQRALEPPKTPPARTASRERPTSPPSQAEQLQRKQNQDRQLQLQQQPQSNEPRPFIKEPRPVKTPSAASPPGEQPQSRTAEEKRGNTVRCNAMPVCRSGGYGSCRGVEQSYGAASLSSSRQDIVRQCVQANTPDSCDCTAQCRQVAQCNIF